MWQVVLAAVAVGGLVGSGASPLAKRLLEDRGRYWAASPAFLVGATATMFGLLAWRIGLHYELAAFGCLAAASAPLVAVDLAELRLPSKIVVPLYPVLIGLFGLAAELAHDAGPFFRALLGMMTLAAFYLIIAVLTHGTLGTGDVRLGGVLGLALAWRGWGAVTAGTMFALAYAGLAGAVAIWLRRADRHTPIAFGPALIGGAFTALLIPTG